MFLWSELSVTFSVCCKLYVFELNFEDSMLCFLLTSITNSHTTTMVYTNSDWSMQIFLSLTLQPKHKIVNIGTLYCSRLKDSHGCIHHLHDHSLPQMRNLGLYKTESSVVQLKCRFTVRKI